MKNWDPVSDVSLPVALHPLVCMPKLPGVRVLCLVLLWLLVLGCREGPDSLQTGFPEPPETAARQHVLGPLAGLDKRDFISLPFRG